MGAKQDSNISFPATHRAEHAKSQVWKLAVGKLLKYMDFLHSNFKTTQTFPQNCLKDFTTLRHQGLFPKPLAHTLHVLSATIPSLQPLKITTRRSLASAHMATKSQDEASCSFSAPKPCGTLAVWSCLTSVGRIA